ncbi:unnamed protein product [Urochloa humidicola]
MSRSTCQFLAVRAMLLLLVGIVILTIVASGEQGSSGHTPHKTRPRPPEIPFLFASAERGIPRSPPPTPTQLPTHRRSFIELFPPPWKGRLKESRSRVVEEGKTPPAAAASSSAGGEEGAVRGEEGAILPSLFDLRPALLPSRSSRAC